MAAADGSLTAVVNASGDATVTIAPTDGINTWTVSQVSVEMESAPGAATCVVRKNGRLVSPLVPQADAASGDPPVTLRPGDQLTVEWSECTPGDIGAVFWVYDDGRPD